MARMLFLAAVLALAARAEAQQPLRLDIRDGRVSLEATGVPVQQVLAEWARVGGTRVIGAERITGAPLTLTLKDVPERQALDIVLRSVAGYVAAPRANALAGASSFDRILVMATSTAPPVTAAARRTGSGVAAPPPDRVEDNPDVVMEQPNLFVPVAPEQQNFGQPAPFGQPTPFGTPLAPGQPNPFMQQPNPFGQPMTPTAQPGTAPFTFTPVPVQQQPVPFGAPAQGQPGSVTTFGSPVPGMPQPQPQQPGQVRPPGR